MPARPVSRSLGIIVLVIPSWEVVVVVVGRGQKKYLDEPNSISLIKNSKAHITLFPLHGSWILKSTIIHPNKTNKLPRNMTIFSTLGTNDVLLGRGTGPNEQIGNIKFRALVREAIEATGKRDLNGKEKAKLSRQVVARVKEIGGRFVRKINQSSHQEEEDEDDGHQGMITTLSPVYYEEVIDALALDKTKQSFRHQLRALMSQDQARPIVSPGASPRLSSCSSNNKSAYLVAPPADGILNLLNKKSQQLMLHHYGDSLRFTPSNPSSLQQSLFTGGVSDAAMENEIAAVACYCLAESLAREQFLLSAQRSCTTDRSRLAPAANRAALLDLLIQHPPRPSFSQSDSSFSTTGGRSVVGAAGRFPLQEQRYPITTTPISDDNKNSTIGSALLVDEGLRSNVLDRTILPRPGYFLYY